MKRETDLIDVWFDSGAMPYAQIHYPFENLKEIFDDRQGLSGRLHRRRRRPDTRMVLHPACAGLPMIFDSVAYKAVVSNGSGIGQERQQDVQTLWATPSIRSPRLSSTVPTRCAGT